MVSGPIAVLLARSVFGPEVEHFRLARRRRLGGQTEQEQGDKTRFREDHGRVPGFKGGANESGAFEVDHSKTTS